MRFGKSVICEVQYAVCTVHTLTGDVVWRKLASNVNNLSMYKASSTLHINDARKIGGRVQNGHANAISHGS